MKYETPEMTVLTTAINAIQAVFPYTKAITGYQDFLDPKDMNEVSGAYRDWE
jgi:hypothetical protein